MKLALRWTLAAFASFSVCTAAFGAEQTLSLAAMQVTLWSPEVEADGPRPVIVFSHGYRGCATQSRFLMEAFASAGYVVFAPNHRDAACHRSGGRSAGAVSFARPERWSEASFRDRADDVRRLIDALCSAPQWRARIDCTRLGLVGHSLGGYTVLGLAGAWPGWRLPGIKAVLALSPYSQPFLIKGTLPGLAAPVMYQGGTLDLGITPSLHKSAGAYEVSPQPKFYVEFDRAGHFVWTNAGRAHRQAISAYSVAFMDRYVGGKAGDALLTSALPGVAALRYASESASGDEALPGSGARVR